MFGIDVATFTDDLVKVSDDLNGNPLASFDPMERIGPAARAYAEARFNDGSKFKDFGHYLPLKALACLTLDEITKIRYSTSTMMDQTVEDEFRSNPRFTVVHKIINSLWRWGYSRGTWNEIVDSYNGIRDFSIDLPDFSVRLDYTTGCNELGWGEHSPTYFDGIFGFLVYYKGEHVMTLGFSILADRQICIQQVQLTKQRGNRWLYKWPANRMEYVITRFKEAFPGYRLHVVDGGDIALKNMNAYKKSLASIRDDFHEAEDRRIKLKAKIKHIRADRKRLAAFYRDCGKYVLGEKASIKRYDLKHYEIFLAL